MPVPTVWIVDRWEDASDPAWEVAALRQSLAERDVRAEVVDWEQLRFGLSRDTLLRSGRESGLPDAMVIRSQVLTRHTAGSVALLYDSFDHLEDCGVRLINRATALRTTENKMRQAQTLHAAGIPVPDTRLVHSVDHVGQCMRDWGEIVLKPVHGHASIDVVRMRPKGVGHADGELLGTREEITAWHLLEHHGVLCAQPYVPNPGRDVRLTVMGGTVAAAVTHVSTSSDGSVRHLLHPYATARVESLPRFEHAALAATAALGLDVATVDLVEGPDGPVVIEVNPTATLWRPLEGTDFDLTEDGITREHARVVSAAVAHGRQR
ncbi:RimK family alpha-L-glutamate ligase [Streptomyces sp. NPDC057245]|uniref:ATP-grasp domain-containing protein n=1 Tax=Streptomyces sp. NPDC057245 TaxID=3346065 RepID=UPI003630A9C5